MLFLQKIHLLIYSRGSEFCTVPYRSVSLIKNEPYFSIFNITIRGNNKNGSLFAKEKSNFKCQIAVKIKKKRYVRYGHTARCL